MPTGSVFNHLPEQFHLLQKLTSAALAAVDATTVTRRALPPLEGPVFVTGAGKAAAAMAQAAEAAYGDRCRGVVITRYQHTAPLKYIEVVEAGHPFPDAAGQKAAARILKELIALEADTTVLALISGGGSSLMALPIPPVTLPQKQSLTKALFEAGATIGEINCVRKHLSLLKGGRLAAAAYPAQTIALAISDVPGDGPDVIASGPTVPDPTSQGDARAVLLKYGIRPEPEVAEVITTPFNESPKDGDMRLARQSWSLVAGPRTWLEAAEARTRAAGWDFIDLGPALEGEAVDVARHHAGLALDCLAQGRPTIIASGGELTVSGASGDHSGGRAREYALSLALALEGRSGIAAVALDSDGIDGSDDAAGGLVDPAFLSDARADGLDPVTLLRQHRSGEVFAKTGRAIVTGPTRTNVADIRLIAVVPWP